LFFISAKLFKELAADSRKIWGRKETVFCMKKYPVEAVIQRWYSTGVHGKRYS